LDRQGLRLLVAGLVAVIAAAVPGCAKGPLDRDSQALFTAGHERFLAGDYRAAEQKFGQVIAGNPTSWALSEVHYFRGLARLKLGRRSEARNDFRKGATLFGRELTQVYSAVALANLEYEEGNDATAAHLYGQALEHRVKGLPIDRVLYRYAVSLQRLGRWAEAEDALCELISDHGDSPLAAAAGRRFHVDAFTVQVGAFANPANARALAEKVRREGYAVTVSPTGPIEKRLNAVCAGRFSTHREAEAAAARLRARGYEALVRP
jgi:TolA-binding protein